MSVKVVIPSLGLTMEDAQIIEWIKQEGEEVVKDDPILLIETDKASVEVVAPESGILGHILANEGEVIPVGEPVAMIYSTEEYAARNVDSPNEDSLASTAVDPVKQPLDFYALDQEHAEMIKASPAAKKLARQFQVDLSFVTGRGPNGRIIENDVLDYHSQHAKHAVRQADTQIQPMTKMRRIIAERMLASSQSTSSVTIFASLRMDEVVRLRSQMNQTLERGQEGKITYDAIFVKAVTFALAEFPALQAQWSPEGLRYPQGIHIGVAVALSVGLVVPVVKNTQSQSLFSVAKETQQLVALAKQGKLLPEQMEGGTFTISNLGIYPIGGFTPVINLPQSAILGIGGIAEQAVVENGAIVIGKIAEISLTFDHRVVDGAPAAEFITRIKSILEQPYQLFMES